MAGDSSARPAVALAVALLLLVTLAFAVAFTATSLPEAASTSDIHAQSAATDVAAAMDGASPAQGEALIEIYQCSLCHIRGEGRVAPSFSGIAERAATRRPSLSAAQYLYESIVSPGAFLVEGYANSMPANFASRLTRAEIGHLIAYLLSTPDGASP